jgi:Fur family ferric uptake transcriptional regulator
MPVVRNTKAKQAVLDEMSRANRALSQPELFERLNGICDRVTVYRILDRLISEKKIHKIVNIDGVLNYALCQTCDDLVAHSHDHFHFSCTQCKRIECLEENQIQVNLPINYQVQELYLTVSGVCPGCMTLK